MTRAGRLTTLAAAGVLVTSVIAVAAAPAVRATSVSVATEAEYRQALTDLSGDAGGPHTVTLPPTSPSVRSATPCTPATRS